MRKISQEEIEEIRKELVDSGIPVRFLHNGSAVNIISGEIMPKNTNVMYHPVYWNFSKETSVKIAKWLGLKPCFHG